MEKLWLLLIINPIHIATSEILLLNDPPTNLEIVAYQSSGLFPMVFVLENRNKLECESQILQFRRSLWGLKELIELPVTLWPDAECVVLEDGAY